MTMPPPQQRPPRWFSAHDILSGRVSLDGYPLRFIFLTGVPSEGFRVTFNTAADHRATIDRVFSACEFLETRGWQVISFEQNGRVAYLRRMG
jgi:hypothetical protein